VSTQWFRRFHLIAHGMALHSPSPRGVAAKPVIEAGRVLAMHSSAVATQLLLDWNRGNEQARDQMLPLVYDERRRLARVFAGELFDHTLEATALVREVYLRLIDQRQVDWRNRAQFVGVAAVMMRRILVNHARGRAADKRGGTERVSLSVAHAIGEAPVRSRNWEPGQES
jgi:hypothetical protein